MFNFLPHIDWFSFWVGAAVATVVWWVSLLARPLLSQLLETRRAQLKNRQVQPAARMEETHRRVVYRQAQGMHIAASLFALDEIVETPRLLAPPPAIEPDAPLPIEDIVDRAVPYLPAWPEVAAAYNGQTLSLPQVLAGGMNLVIVGQPGTGKTVALAHLATLMARKSAEAGELADGIPFLLHVADLGLPLPDPQKPEDLLKPIVDFVSTTASVLSLGRIPTFVQYAFQSERAVLLLDGVDELPPAAIQQVADYLKLLLKAYPKVRVVTTGAPEYVDGILSLGFAALTLVPWSQGQQAHFIENWSNLWQQYVAVESWAQTVLQPVEPLLLNRWLSGDDFGLTPLEFTLKVWAAYAGDVRGARPLDALDAHIRRLLPSNVSVEALYVLGAQSALNGQLIFDNKTATEWIKSFEGAENAPASEEQAVETVEETVEESDTQESVDEAKKNPKKGSAVAAPRASLLSQLANNGLLMMHSGNRLRFFNPALAGFLAGQGLSGHNAAANLLDQSPWSGQAITLHYLAAFSDISGIVDKLLAQQDKLLMRPQLTTARLLREAPQNATWRGKVMTSLIQIIQDEDYPIGLRGQAMAAFALSGDSGAATLFRQLLAASSNELRRLAATGAGLLQDVKAVDGLISILSQSLGAARDAACLALVKIGTAQALEAVATGLLRGDEELRRAAAEALANHPSEGFEALRDGITSEDILVRRAIVYGLGRVNQPWAQQILEQTQVQDEQWAVRNVAVELIAERTRPNPRVPRRLLPPAQTPWVIEFAGKHGTGVIPGQPATDVFLLALKDDGYETRQAALNYLRYMPSEGVIAALYQAYYSIDLEFKEYIYQVLSDFALGGITLPDPAQFGLG